MSDDLKSTTVRNVSYNTIATIFVSIVQFCTSILLARVLVAQDYGIVGFAQIFINFFMQFCDFGLDRAVIQKNETNSTVLYTAFTLKTILSFLLFVLILIFAPFAQYLMNLQAIPNVIRLLSCNFLISILFFLPQVTLTRELKYQKLVIPQTVSVAFSSILTILLAYNGFAFWSIVCGSLIANSTTALIYFRIKPHPLRFEFDERIAKELLRFGGSLLLPGLVIFLIMNIDNFTIGSLLGAQELGYYAIAFNWGSMICILMAGFFHKVLFPTFSRFQNDILIMKKAYLMSLKYIAFIAIPINILLLVEGREFLFYVLGRESERWLPALLTFQILCVYGILRAVLEPVGNVIMGLGKPQLMIRAILIVAVIEMGLLYPSIKFYGIAGVAVVVTGAYLTQFIVYCSVLKKEIQVVPIEFYEAVKVSICSASIMALILICLKGQGLMTLESTVINSVIAFICYILVYGFLDKQKLFKEIRTMIRLV